MRRLFWMLLIIALGAAFFRLWGREGLLGLEWLQPQGGLLARWLRGTDLAPFELLIWVVGVFLILTGLQKIFDRFTR